MAEHFEKSIGDFAKRLENNEKCEWLDKLVPNADKKKLADDAKSMAEDVKKLDRGELSYAELRAKYG